MYTHYNIKKSIFWIRRPGSQLRTNSSQQRLTRLRSGLCAGHWSSNHVFMDLALYRGTFILKQKINYPKLLSQGWNCRIFRNVFVSCSIYSNLHWKHLNSFGKVFAFLWPNSLYACIESWVVKGVRPLHQEIGDVTSFTAENVLVMNSR